MSCIIVNINKISSSPIVRTTNLEMVDVDIEITKSSIGIHIEDVSKRIQVIPTLTLNKQLNISCGIVCTLTEVKYLQVSPKEVQWITPNIGVIYNVTSNVEWRIE